MAEISAGLVKELRELTGLGMMECKKALAECAGDLKKAEELLRIKSGAKASKAASRIAAEGVIGAWVAADAKLGALVELNSETDFVAKNDEFVDFARSLAELAATRDPGSAEEDQRQKLVQKLGENISIRRWQRLQARGKLALYLHGGNYVLVASAPAKIAVESFANVGVRRVGLAVEQIMRAHDHAGGAEAALQTVLFPESVLKGMQLVTRRQALHGSDAAAVCLNRQDSARFDGTAVHEHRTGTA